MYFCILNTYSKIIMKNLIYLFAVVCLLSCTGKSLYTIEGTLPSHKYDGEWIYLVPMENANRTNVDSFKIKNGYFEFKGDTERISILRMKPLYRLEMQELLVITEKGVIKVSIDKNSVAKGTPQNDALQLWKDKQIAFMQMARKAYVAVRTGHSVKDSLNWVSKMDSADKDMKNFSIKLLKQQKRNTFGKFLYGQYSFWLSPADKARLKPLFEGKK